jgi:DNA-binding MarR family transcriptional regulator
VEKAADLPGPPSEYLRLSYEVSLLLLEMASRLQQNFAARAAEFDLSGPQVKVLLALQLGESIPMRALAGRLHYDSSNLTGLVDQLEERGAVVRLPDPGDRRVKAIAITEDGLRLRAAFWQRTVGDAGVLKSLDEQQMATLRDLLRHAAAKA